MTNTAETKSADQQPAASSRGRSPNRPAPWMPTYRKQDAAVAVVMFGLLLGAVYAANQMVVRRAPEPITSSGYQSLLFNHLRFHCPETWLVPANATNPAQLSLTDPTRPGFLVDWFAFRTLPHTPVDQSLSIFAKQLGVAEPTPPKDPPRAYRDERLQAALTGEMMIAGPNGQPVQRFFGVLSTADGRVWAFRLRQQLPPGPGSNAMRVANQLMAYELITSASLPRPDPNVQPNLQHAPTPAPAPGSGNGSGSGQASETGDAATPDAGQNGHPSTTSETDAPKTIGQVPF